VGTAAHELALSRAATSREYNMMSRKVDEVG
jgi:hypothetical protein